MYFFAFISEYICTQKLRKRKYKKPIKLDKISDKSCELMTNYSLVKIKFLFASLNLS